MVQITTVTIIVIIKDWTRRVSHLNKENPKRIVTFPKQFAPSVATTVSAFIVTFFLLLICSCSGIKMFRM